MIITSVFQKLSLVAPVILGLVIFGEEGTWIKYLAIVLTIISIILINYTSSKDSKMTAAIKQYWYLPLLVFFGSGLIESVLFYAQEAGKVKDAGLVFTSNLFFMAGCWGILFMIVTGRLRFTSRDVLGGILIGIPNFFTIYLIMKGLADGWEGSVLFPLNNVGVIFFTAILGIIVFREYLNRWNMLGLVLALVSVVLISQ